MNKLIKKIKEKSQGNVVFVGDGINDTPVLVTSDIGISMGGLGSDAAIEASDIVLMHDDLKCIPILKRIAKKIFSGNVLMTPTGMIPMNL